jgi:hypothetical protein
LAHVLALRVVASWWEKAVAWPGSGEHVVRRAALLLAKAGAMFETMFVGESHGVCLDLETRLASRSQA